MKRMIKGYIQETDFVNSGAGTATWCIASKDGKKYFIKSFLEITLLDEETAKNLPAPMAEAKRKSCVQFRIRKERLYNKLNEIQNGVFIYPKELLVYNGHFCAVTDYIESFEESNKIHKFTPRRKTILMRTIVLALKDLSDNHIVHSDLKPDNIIITYNQKKKPQLKIIDFDSGFFEDAPPHNVNEYHGDMVYFAPESMVFMQAEGESDIRLTCAVDKFAMGLILHQMWCGMLPEFNKNECANVAEALLLDKPFVLHGSIPKQLKTIIHGFLQEDPDKRMSYDQAYNLLGELLETLPDDDPEIEIEKEQPKPPEKPEEPKTKAEVNVVYVDATNGKEIFSRTLTIAAGHEIAVVPQKFDGYKCLDKKCLIRVDEHGHTKLSTIKFKYKKTKGKAWIWLLIALAIALIAWYAADRQSKQGNGNSSTRTKTSTAQAPIISVSTGYNTVFVSKGETVRVSFTAPSTGKYSFTTIGSANTYGFLYTSATGDIVDYNNDGGIDRNFKLERKLSTNETIYIGIKYLDSSTSGNTILSINMESARTFELNDNISMNKGRATVNWTDSANDAPYEVYYQCVGSEGVSHPSYYAGGDQASSTTYSKSFTIDDLIPGKTYIVKIIDCNNQKRTKTYTIPYAGTFVDGDLYASSINISTEPRCKNYGSSNSSASSISQLRASTIMSNINSKEYGIRFDIDYPELSKSKTYFTQIAIIAPNGYTECVVSRSIDYKSSNSGTFFSMIGEWAFENIYEYNSTIPSGTWVVELYWDGMFVKRTTFTVA